MVQIRYIENASTVKCTEQIIESDRVMMRGAMKNVLKYHKLTWNPMYKGVDDFLFTQKKCKEANHG